MALVATSLAGVTIAAPSLATRQGPSTAPQCRDRGSPPQCCEQVLPASSDTAASLLGLLGVGNLPGDVPIGVECTPMAVVTAAGETCSQEKIVCCNFELGGTGIGVPGGSQAQFEGLYRHPLLVYQSTVYVYKIEDGHSFTFLAYSAISCVSLNIWSRIRPYLYSMDLLSSIIDRCSEPWATLGCIIPVATYATY
ncbi:hypothetical protein BKA70DRAFT_1222291 [Coprinopsis sp. MPI-PUGE-AT-0042]|nr:hypothetical protein BKA70DRAFT_1222291 [Coprinopsis sp. MPI-PUGE-AT-0042]